MTLARKYIELKPNLLVKEKKLKLLPQIDSLILDIDGVILDVTKSFRVAISQTVQYYFTHILKCKGGAQLISSDETQLFKLAGGFNNDWELTFAVVLFYLAKSEALSSESLPAIREQGQTLRQFTAEISRLGGGLETAKKLSFKRLDGQQRERVGQRWQTDLIKQIFQEYYGGSDYCQGLYGFQPKYIDQPGLLNNEKVILDANLVKSFSPKVGVITGRTREEAEMALQRADLSELVAPGYLLCDDWNFHKPDPKILLYLAGAMGTKIGLYIGDTVDDLETVKNFQNLGESTSFLACIVLHRPEERGFYLEKGVDILTRDVNQVLKALAM